LASSVIISGCAGGNGVFVAGRELLDPVVAGVSDPKVAVAGGGVGDRGRFFELAFFASRGAEFRQQFGLGLNFSTRLLERSTMNMFCPPSCAPGRYFTKWRYTAITPAARKANCVST
jgi:hypothetical protein